MNIKFKTICAALALLLAPLTGQALPVTYNITSGSAPGFSGSWLHAGTDQMGTSGFFANGAAARINGSLTLDMSGPVTASGQLSGFGDFGLGGSNWTIDITGGSSGTHQFLGGEVDLLSLDYSLSSTNGHSSNGIFHFAARDFNGGPIENGPNYINNDILYLWGNNWVNENGAIDRENFSIGYESQTFNNALGLDLYGEAVEVPEPGMLALLIIGLIGVGAKRRLQKF